MEALKRIRSLSGFEQAQQPVTKSEPLEGDIGPSAGPADNQPFSQASEPTAAVDTAAVASIDCAVHEAQEGRIIENSADDAIQLGAKQKHDSSSSNLSSNSDIDSLNKVTETLQKTPVAQEENQYLVQTIPVIEKSAVEQSITAQVPSAAADVSVSCSNQSFSEQVLSCRSDNLIDKSSKSTAETSSVARTNLVKSNQKDKVVQDFEEQSAKRSPDNKDDDIISVAPTIENVLEIEKNLETDVKEKKTNTSQVILQQQKRLDLQTTTSFLDSDLVDNSQQILSKVDLTSKDSATSQEKLSSTESHIPIPTKSSGSNSEILSAQNLLEETEFESFSVSERKVSHKTYKIQTETESEDAGPNKSDKAKQWTKKALKTSAFAIGAAAASVVVLPALGAAAIGAGTGKAVKSAIARSKKASSPNSKTDLSDSEEQQVEFSPLSEASDNPEIEFGKPNKNFTESESLKELAELNAQIVEFDNNKKSSQISSDEIDFAKSKIPKLIESERIPSVSNKPQEVFIEPDVDISVSEEISTNSEAQSEYSANISGLSKVVELTELDSSKVDSTRSIESESISKDFSKDSLEVTEKVEESESRSSSQSEENSGETISTESPHLKSVSNSEISSDSRKHSIELQRVESTESHEVSIDLQGVESRKLSIELTVSEGITSKVEFTGSEVELLQSEIELIDSKVELAESEIELLKSKIELIDSQVESTEAKVESTEANLKSTESKVKSTESSKFQETSTESKVVDSRLELTKSQEVSSELVVESHQPKSEEKVQFRDSKLISPEKEFKITECVPQSETPESTENTTAISTPVTDSIEGLQKAKGHFKPDQTPIDPAYNQSIQKDSAESKSGARSTSSLVEPGTELTDLRPESCQVKQEESQGVEPVWTDEPDLAVGAKTAVSSLEPSHTRSSQCPKETETISVEHLEAVEKQNLLPFDEKKPSEEVTYFFGTQSEDNQNDSESLIESKVKSTESKVEHLEADKQTLLPFDEKKPSEEVTYFFGTQSEDQNDSDGSENEAEPEVKEKTPTGSSAKQWTKNALKASAFAIGAAAASVVVLPALGGAAIVAGTGSAASAIAGSAVFSGTSGLAAATLATGATATAAVAVSSSTKDSENSSNSEVIELESTTIEEGDSTNSDSFCKDQKGQSHSFTFDPSSNAQVASHQSSLSL